MSSPDAPAWMASRISCMGPQPTNALSASEVRAPAACQAAAMRRPPLSPRLAGLGTTIFAEMSALAVATGAINLGQGFPDEDGPIEVADAAIAAIRAGVNQYPPGPGIGELRVAIAQHQARFWGIDVDPATEVLVTAGATEAIAATVLALCDPGDEILAFEPTYDSYTAVAAMAGARLRPVTLRPPGYEADVDALAALVTDRTRLAPAQHAAQPHRQGVHRSPSSRRSPACASSTTSSRSPTRCTSTSCSTASTDRWARSPAWPSARSPSARRGRRSASPAGRSAGCAGPRSW